MNRQQWQRAIEPAPENFHRAVAHALRTKEEQQPMKRAIPRALILVCALVLALTSVALAAETGLLDFLHLDTLGKVNAVQPEMHMVKPGQYLTAEIRQAACDGVSAHIVVAYSVKNKNDALRMDYDWNNGNIDFAAERAACQRELMVNTQWISEKTTGMDLDNTGIQWRYESAQTMVVDYSADLRGLAEIPEQLTLVFDPTAYLAGNETYAEADALSFEVTLPAQTVEKEVWQAKNIPDTGANWKLDSLTLTRTDMGCYLDVEVEDPDKAECERLLGADFEGGSKEAAEKLPLRGSFWVDALDASGNAYARLSGGFKENLSEDEEWTHEIIHVYWQRFEVGDTITIRPYDSGTKKMMDTMTLQMEKVK